MKKILTWPVGILTACVFQGCNEKKPDSFYLQKINNSSWKQSPQKSKPLCIILCDFTSSMDSASREFVRQKSARILEHYYNKTLLKFFSISNKMDVPFFETGMLTAQESTWKSKLYNRTISRTNTIFLDSFRREIDIKAQDSMEKSYILQSVEKAIRLFHEFDSSGQNRNRLIILSDMLEIGNSSFGDINLEDRSTAGDMSMLDRASDNILTMKKFQNLEINIIRFTNKNVPMQVIEQFWNKAFNKFGYHGEIIYSSDFSFSD